MSERRAALDLAVSQGAALRALAAPGRVLVVVAPGATEPEGLDGRGEGRAGARIGYTSAERASSWAPLDVARAVATPPGGPWWWCIVRTREGTAAVPLTWASTKRGAA